MSGYGNLATILCITVFWHTFTCQNQVFIAKTEYLFAKTGYLFAKTEYLFAKTGYLEDNHIYRRILSKT